MTELDIKKEVERQYNILKRGCEEIINEEVPTDYNCFFPDSCW